MQVLAAAFEFSTIAWDGKETARLISVAAIVGPTRIFILRH